MTTEETTIVEAPLSPEERGSLAKHEATIERGQQTFIEVGLALADISRRRLYRETHASLEAYLADRYPDISRRRAYQLMDAADTAQQLAAPPATVNHGTHSPPPLPTPTSERALRPLAGLEPEQKREVYQQAAAAAGGKAPTAAQVETAARAVKPPPKPAPVAPTATPAPAGEVIASAPATPPPPLTPAPPLPTLTPLTPAPAAPLDAGVLRQAEALVALLEQALSLAQAERDRLQRDLPDAHYNLPDEPVEAAARAFLASPAVRAAASFLAMHAREAS